ncbi:MAG: alkaline phosphatase D family protein, partial [Bacteroidota bacterium]
TLPPADEVVPVTFTSSTCQYFWDYDDPVRGFRIYDAMRQLNPAFHCQTGDYVYYDKPGPLAKTVALARHKWTAINAWPSLRDFYTEVPLFIQRDDHDVLDDDAHPASEPYGELTFSDGLLLWNEQTPTDPDHPYRRIRYGKDLEIWLVEGRALRTPNPEPDGPEKSIWGKEQVEWFKETLRASDATFKILMSPTPVVGPDRTNKSDNHANANYAAEGRWLRRFLANQPNTFVVNGDRHWQYVSRDTETGLYEFSQGPSSDEHAQGWKKGDQREEHEFLRVAGGFLSVTVSRKNGNPTIRFRHHDTRGVVVNEKEVVGFGN